LNKTKTIVIGGALFLGCLFLVLKTEGILTPSITIDPPEERGKANGKDLTKPVLNGSKTNVENHAATNSNNEIKISDTLAWLKKTQLKYSSMTTDELEKTLKLTLVGITDDDLKFLKPLQMLHHVVIEGDVTGVGFAHLSENEYLFSIILKNQSSVTDEGVEVIITSIKQLSRLDLSNTLISDEAMKSIAKGRDISDLNLSGTFLSDYGMKHLAVIKSRKKIYGLKTLNLNDTYVTDKSIVFIKHIKP